MTGTMQFPMVRSTVIAGLVAVAAGCADAVAPTGPTLRSEPLMAASGGGGAVVKSMIGLEPLLDAAQNLSRALSVSDLGQVVGTSATNTIASIYEHAVIWEGSTFATDLGTLSGDLLSSAAAIKSDGSVIVGVSHGQSSQRPVRWVKPNGSWVIDELRLPADAERCYAVDIASDGTIAGGCYASGTPTRITLWRNGVPIDIAEGIPSAVNAVGQVVGGDGNNQGFIWDTRTSPATVTPLGTLGGAFTSVRDINDLGEVVGMSRNVAEQYRPFLWTAKRGMVELGILPGATSGSANAINNQSQIVGSSTTTANPSPSHAVLWSKGKVTDLGVLPGYDVSSAASINSNGKIAGHSFSTTVTNTMRATLWTVK